MTFARGIMAAFLAATLVWAGAAAHSAHAHDLTGKHADAIHAVAFDADGDHHAAIHAHGDQDDEADMDSHDKDTVPSEQGGDVFHVHAHCFIALAAESSDVQHDTPTPAIAVAELVVSLHTRNIGPADRPPRTFL